MTTTTALLLLLAPACASTPKAPAAPVPAAEQEMPQESAADWVRKGVAHRAAGRLEEAEGAYNEAIKIDKDQPDVWFDLANLQLATGRAKEALEQYDQSLRLKPDDVDAQINRAHALTALHQFQLAARGFAAATERVPGRDDAWTGLGAARQRLGDGAGAIEAFRRAHDLEPNARTRFNLGMQLSQGLLHGGKDVDLFAEPIALLQAYLAAPLEDPRDTNAKKRLEALRKAKEEAR